MDALERLFEESFPSVSTEARAQVRSFFAQNQRSHKWMFAASVAPEPAQGDIVVELPTFFFESGRVRVSRARCPVILLEHECDMVPKRSETYVFAPLFPYEKVVTRFADRSALDSNIITTKLLMRGIPGLGGDYIADFDMLGSISARSFHESVSKGELRRVASLSRDGFYFLLSKLSAHLLRASRERWPAERSPPG